MQRSLRLIASVGIYNIAGSISHNGDLLAGFLACVAAEVRPARRPTKALAAAKKADASERNEPPWFERIGLVGPEK